MLLQVITGWKVPVANFTPVKLCRVNLTPVPSGFQVTLPLVDCETADVTGTTPFVRPFPWLWDSFLSTVDRGSLTGRREPKVVANFYS